MSIDNNKNLLLSKPIGYARLIHIPKTISIDYGELDSDDSDIDNILIHSKLLTKGLKYIRKNKIEIERGDIVHYQYYGEDYNYGKVIYDGIKLINLDPDIDDHGGIVNCFETIKEFPIGYWSHHIIAHNTIWFNIESVLDELKTNMDYFNMKSTFHYNNQKYEIYYDYKYDNNNTNGDEKYNNNNTNGEDDYNYDIFTVKIPFRHIEDQFYDSLFNVNKEYYPLPSEHKWPLLYFGINAILRDDVKQNGNILFLGTP